MLFLKNIVRYNNLDNVYVVLYVETTTPKLKSPKRYKTMIFFRPTLDNQKRGPSHLFSFPFCHIAFNQFVLFCFFLTFFLFYYECCSLESKTRNQQQICVFLSIYLNFPTLCPVRVEITWS